ncbi:MAG TPA: hypothetical protein PKA27_17520, partial [Fimbriimonadaceae bacterium]|nr:hypothetical protein [Fimbriimonadaceae bacterium]
YTDNPDFPVSIQDAYFFGLGNGGVTKWMVSSYPDYDSLDIAENGVAYSRMHFSPGGRVGINSEAPQHALDVNGGIASNIYMRVFAEGYGFFQEGTTTNVGTYVDASGGYVGSTQPNSLHFFTGNSWAQATLTTSGNFGIGTETPSAKLEVIGSGGNPGVVIFGDGFNGMFSTTSGTDGNGITAVANTGSLAYGVWGVSDSGVGVVGQNQGGGYGVYAIGPLGASGTKTFRIDHPQDPLNKYLLHYSAEGPEPQNIYNGTITTDEQGQAWVELPSYYNDINRDPRIQLTVDDESDEFVMVKAVGGVKGNGFRIRTSRGNIKVYWEVKAVRNDAYVQKYGAPVEVNKKEGEKGKYQHPDLYGAPQEMAMKYRAPSNPKVTKREGSRPLPPKP